MSTVLPGESDAPLSERERKLLNRLLSDPTVYPMQLKSWIVPFLEASELDLPLTAVHGLLARLDDLGAPLRRLPSGTLLLYDGVAAPEGTTFFTPSGPFHGLLTASGLKLIRVT